MFWLVQTPKPSSTPFVLEALEQRILLSSDALLAPAPDPLAHGASSGNIVLEAPFVPGSSSVEFLNQEAPGLLIGIAGNGEPGMDLFSGVPAELIATGDDVAPGAATTSILAEREPQASFNQEQINPEVGPGTESSTPAVESAQGTLSNGALVLSIEQGEQPSSECSNAALKGAVVSSGTLSPLVSADGQAVDCALGSTMPAGSSDFSNFATETLTTTLCGANGPPAEAIEPQSITSDSILADLQAASSSSSSSEPSQSPSRHAGLLSGADPLLSDYVSQIQSGFSDVKRFLGSLNSYGAFASTLPLVGQNLGGVIDLGSTFQSMVVNKVNSYLASAGTLSASGLAAALQQTGLAVVNGSSGTELVWRMSLTKSYATSATLDLGSQAAALGLSVNGPPPA
jgi:hypothetical protein